MDIRQPQSRSTFRVRRLALVLAVSTTALLISGCASMDSLGLGGFGMSADQIASSWVGRDVSQLQDQWSSVSWDDGTDPKSGLGYITAAFGVNAHTETEDSTYTAATGQNQYTQYTDTQEYEVPRRIDCEVAFYFNTQTRRITNYESSGQGCTNYFRQRGPAPQ